MPKLIKEQRKTYNSPPAMGIINELNRARK